MYCIIPMSTLTSNFGYSFDQTVYVKASAYNSYGFGTTSSANTSGAKIRKVPDQMAQPSLNVFSTDTTIILYWSSVSGSSAGNSDVLSYNLYWDAGSGTANIELTDTLVTSYTIYGVTGGQPYIFKLRARNIYGYGDFSNTLTISPSDVPGKMDMPTVELSGTDVKVSWTAPTSHSSSITAYDIEFLKSDGTTYG